MKKLYAILFSLIVSVSAYATPNVITYGVGTVTDSVTHEKSSAHNIKANISISKNVDFSIFNRTQVFNASTSTVAEFVPNYYIGDFSVGAGVGRDLTAGLNYNIITANYTKPVHSSGTSIFVGGQVNYKPDVRNHKLTWFGVSQPLTENVFINVMKLNNTGTFKEKEYNISLSVLF